MAPNIFNIPVRNSRKTKFDEETAKVFIEQVSRHRPLMVKEEIDVIADELKPESRSKASQSEIDTESQRSISQNSSNELILLRTDDPQGTVYVIAL